MARRTCAGPRHRRWFAGVWRDAPLSDALVEHVGRTHDDHLEALTGALAVDDDAAAADITTALCRRWRAPRDDGAGPALDSGAARAPGGDRPAASQVAGLPGGLPPGRRLEPRDARPAGRRPRGRLRLERPAGPGLGHHRLRRGRHGERPCQPRRGRAARARGRPAPRGGGGRDPCRGRRRRRPHRRGPGRRARGDGAGRGHLVGRPARHRRAEGGPRAARVRRPARGPRPAHLLGRRCRRPGSACGRRAPSR